MVEKIQRYGTSCAPREDGIFCLYAEYEKVVAEREALRAALISKIPTPHFALVVDRTYEGEGISLATWNGENYNFPDGDCYDREGDTLDGYEAEWLTDHQLEQLVRVARAKEQA
jgi:hypothetical protein